MAETYPGANVIHSNKKPRGIDLTEKQKKYNRTVNGIRARVEHAIGRIKRFEILNRPYDGTTTRLAQEIRVATGLANFKLLWDPKIKDLRIQL